MCVLHVVHFNLSVVLSAVEEVAREHRGHPAGVPACAGAQGSTEPVRAPSAASLEDEFEFSSDDGTASSSEDEDEDECATPAPAPAKRVRTETEPAVSPQAPPVPSEDGNTLTVQVRVVGQRPVVVRCTDTERVGALTARLQAQLQMDQSTPATLCTAYPRRALDPASTLGACGVRDRTVLVLEPK